MAALANVALTNTFDEHRIRTNQIIFKLNEVETTPINFTSNTTNVLTVSASARLGNTVFLSSNALSRFGGTISGDLEITGNLTISGTGTLNLL